MKTIFGSLRHAFYTGNKTHMIWCAAILLTMLALAVLHHRWRDDAKKLKLWRLLCLIPLLTAAAHFIIYVSTFPMVVGSFIPLYLIGIAALLPMLFAKRRIGYRIAASLAGVFSVLCGFYFCANSPNFINFARLSYTDSFHALVRELDEHYIMKDWKNIDFYALEEKYMPMVQQAEQEQDKEKFANAIKLFSYELHDGHVWADGFYDDVEPFKPVYTQREYGMAMVRLDNGDTIAICTSDELHAQGIEDGTLITKWNGKPVSQAAAEDVLDTGFPVKSNFDLISSILLAGVGGETVEVSFIDESGTETTVTLTDSGDPHTVQQAIDALRQKPSPDSDEGLEALYDQNFSAKMLTDRCGYLALNAEETESGLQDILGYVTGSHKWAKEMFREKLRALKADGMEYLVIDARNNLGGTDVIGMGLAELLTNEDYYGHGLGIRKNGRDISVSDHYIRGDGEFAELKVVVLTNYSCASAGDGASLYLSRLSNVTLAGITDPNGCNQESGGVIVLSDGVAAMGYPVGIVLNEDGEMNIDTGADRISRNPVEERIPLDYDAAMKIFHDKEDHELAWAIEYLENNA